MMDDVARRTAPAIAELLGLRVPPRPDECPECDTAMKPELLATDGTAPKRVWYFVCKCCAKTWSIREM